MVIKKIINSYTIEILEILKKKYEKVSLCQELSQSSFSLEFFQNPFFYSDKIITNLKYSVNF